MPDPASFPTLTPPTTKPQPSPEVERILNDPGFQAKTPEVQIGILSAVDPKFKALSSDAQKQALDMLLLPSTLPRQTGQVLWQNAPSIAATLAAGLSVPATGGFSLAGMGLGALAAGMAGAGTSTIQQAIQAGRGGETPSFEEFRNRALREGAIQAGTELGGRLATGLVTAPIRSYLSPRRLMTSAVMPGGTSAKAAEKPVMAALREGMVLPERALEPEEGAVAQALEPYDRKIAELGKQVEDIIRAQPANIPPSKYVTGISARLDRLRSTVKGDPIERRKMLRAIDKMEAEFLREHGNVKPIVTQAPPTQGPILNNQGQPILGPNRQPVMTTHPGVITTRTAKDMTLGELRANAQPLASGDAQAIKQAAWHTIRTKVGAAGKSPWILGKYPELSTSVRSEIGNEMMSRLEELYPQIGGINRREGGVIELRKAVDNYLQREGKKRMTPYFLFGELGAAGGAGLGYHVMGGGGAGAGAGVGALLGAYAGREFRSLLEDPVFKSKLAIALYKIGRKPGMRALGGAAAFAGREAVPTGIRYLEDPRTDQLNNPRNVYIGKSNNIPVYRAPAESKPTPMPRGQPRASIQQYGRVLADASVATGLPLGLLRGMMRRESGSEGQAAVSRKGAIGLMQVMPATAAKWGMDPNVPEQNIQAGAYELNDMLTRYHGNKRKALAAYNAGPDVVDRYGDVPPFPETQAYVKALLPLWR